MLSMRHVKLKFKFRLKFAAGTQVVKRITKLVQKHVMIYLDSSQYFNLWLGCQSLHLHSILTSAYLRPSKCITPTLKIRWIPMSI